MAAVLLLRASRVDREYRRLAECKNDSYFVPRLHSTSRFAQARQCSTRLYTRIRTFHSPKHAALRL